MNNDVTIPGPCVEAVKALKDGERGRLWLAAIIYQCECRELSLPGGERYLWPEFKAAIDKQKAEEVALRLARAEAGKASGRARSKNEQNEQVFKAPPSSPLGTPNNPPLSPKKEKPPKGGKKKEGFSPPTLDEVRAYCLERQNGIDPEAFFAHYEANGWVQGKTCKPIVNWKACVITWERTRAKERQTLEQQEEQKPRARRFLRTEYVDGEEVAIFEDI